MGKCRGNLGDRDITKLYGWYRLIMKKYLAKVHIERTQRLIVIIVYKHINYI